MDFLALVRELTVLEMSARKDGVENNKERFKIIGGFNHVTCFKKIQPELVAQHFQ